MTEQASDAAPSRTTRPTAHRSPRPAAWHGAWRFTGGTYGPPRRMSLLMLVVASVALHGCGGGGGDSAPPPAPAKPPTAQATSVSLDVLGAAPSTVSGKVTASDPQGLALTYTVTSAPSAGTVTIDARTGAFSYAVTGHPASSQDSFTVSVSNGQAAATSAVVTVQLQVDPLLVNQWHIRNTGASAFSTVLPVAGNDMNVAGAWAAGYTGKGIKVAVVDSGLEIEHEDLAANVDKANSFNYLTGTNDPSPAPGTAGADHGTEVAGIIGAVAFNGKGGRGVSFGARLRGYNYTLGPVTNYAAALGGATYSADNAVFNASFTSKDMRMRAPDQAMLDIEANLSSLRSGLGAVLVRSAGNDFVDIPGLDPRDCEVANRLRVSCANPGQEPRISTPIPIVVGATNAEGRRASYSTAGSSLWVSAPGGEYGVDSTYRSVSQSPDAENLVKPAIVSTARSGCANRQHAPGMDNALVTGNHRHALNCQYTATMNGTSAAAPNVSATVALMLEANPKLSARDVKEILARTAKRIDPSLAPVTTTTFVSGATTTVDQGWVRNANGFWFSNAYGFGLVDAAAAADMAKGYTSFLPAQKSTPMLTSTARAGVVVPPDSVTGYELSLANYNFTFSTVEQVVVSVSFEETAALQCNQVEVTSPAGTKSILLHAGNGYLQTSAFDVRLLTNAFYGEPVRGTWKFKYFNFCSGRTLLHATKGQGIQIYGR